VLIDNMPHYTDGVQVVASSNLAAPTKKTQRLPIRRPFVFLVTVAPM